MISINNLYHVVSNNIKTNNVNDIINNELKFYSSNSLTSNHLHDPLPIVTIILRGSKNPITRQDRP